MAIFSSFLFHFIFVCLPQWSDLICSVLPDMIRSIEWHFWSRQLAVPQPLWNNAHLHPILKPYLKFLYKNICIYIFQKNIFSEMFAQCDDDRLPINLSIHDLRTWQLALPSSNRGQFLWSSEAAYLAIHFVPFLVNPRLCVFESQMSCYLALMRNATTGDIVERDSWILDKPGIVFEHV